MKLPLRILKFNYWVFVATIRNEDERYWTIHFVTEKIAGEGKWEIIDTNNLLRLVKDPSNFI